jgi:predicted RNA-binding protein with PIN domain
VSDIEVLIDAYNAMFAHPQIGPLVRRDNQAAREEFLAFVAQNRPAGAERIYVVFDAHRDPSPTTQTGRTRESTERGLHVVYATETADTWIQNRIRQAADPRQITVVTSDREILATVAAHQAQVLRVSTFMRLRQRSARRVSQSRSSDKPSHMSKRELERWEKLFRERDDEEDSSS